MPALCNPLELHLDALADPTTFCHSLDQCNLLHMSVRLEEFLDEITRCRIQSRTDAHYRGYG